ncbi:hypothetical protein AAFF_G00266730 [Aldrovandia affinis]|uniref:Uncharacterized protein n=1 Tax=Aldrovandia affinis TaxID=143900 RepID=A0AAD7W293_9TELE|nr:hypothetical protein AAFF_G00266730 [Aldrovandia affinis]
MASESPSAARTPEEAGPGDRLVIFIPKEAEGMGLPPSAPTGAGTVTWISPVVLQEKGSRAGLPISHCGRQARAWLAAAACGSAPGSGRGQCWLPVTCSSLRAFQVLREFLPRGGGAREARGAPEACRPLRVPAGRTLSCQCDAIFVHGGRIFLSVARKGAGSRGSTPPKALPNPPVWTCPRPLPKPSASPPRQPAAPCPPPDAPGLLAVIRHFGVEARAEVRVHKLPRATLKRLRTDGRVRLEEQPPIGRLCSEAERSGETTSGQFHTSRAQEAPGNNWSEGASSSSGDRKPRVSHDQGRLQRDAGFKEPEPKKAKPTPDLVSPGLERPHGSDVEHSAWPAPGTVDPPAARPDYAVGFDFEQSARDERINRIRAQLREREAALKNLSLSV